MNARPGRRDGAPDFTASVDVRLLGPLEVSIAGVDVEVRRVKERVVLALLALRANQLVSVTQLEAGLWDDHGSPRPTSNVRVHVSRLRKTLGTHSDGAERLIITSGGGYLCKLPPQAVDVWRFEQLAATGKKELAAGDADAAGRTLRRALAQWRDRVLADLTLPPAFQPELVRLEEERLAVLEARVDADLRCGRHHELAAELEQLTAESPLRERLWGQRMVALYRSGRQAEALRAYGDLRTLLREELGISPSPALQELERAVLDQDGTLNAPRRDAVSSVGRPRDDSRDLAVGPPTGETASDRPRAHHLPRDLTSFVSRPKEMADIAALLETPGLVTLVGAGGSGKTRLALRTAWEAVPSCDGVRLCELAPLEDGNQVVPELATALGCRDQPGAELVQTVAERLAVGRNLVVLDNCEHLLDAVAVLATRLLRTVPDLRLLATSRSPLGVDGERVYRVPSMSTPDSTAVLSAEGLIDYESVRLFVDRAINHRPGFRVGPADCRDLAAICARLDGNPLALELAAARVRSMSIADIAGRLDDRFEVLTGGARVGPARQTSLKACIDWSFDLLDEREQVTLGRLAVFAGGFDLAAAESVAPRPGGRVLVVDSVASLVDQSLVQLDTTGRTARYRMLDTVRGYALDRLRDLGTDEERDARSAHAAYFLDLAEKAAPSFVGDGHLAWKIRMDADHENLRAAFVTMLADRDPTGALRFGVALSRFWNSRGLYGEEIELLEAALARPHEGLAPTVLAAALNAVGYLLFRQGATAQAQVRLDEALHLADQAGSDALRADALRTLAWVAARRGQPDQAVQLASQAVEAALASGESHLISRAYDVRAAVCHHHDPAGARADYSEALRHGRAAHDAMGQATALNNLAILELEQGDHHAAQRLFGEAQVITEEIRDESLHPFINYGIGVTALFEEDTLVARRAIADSWHGARESGQQSLMAYALLGLGVVHVLDGRVEPGALLLGASSALFEHLGEEPEQIEAALYAKTVDLARRQLGEGADRAVDTGGRLPAAEVARLVTGTAPELRTKVQTLNLTGHR